jgi:hypothetical protein
VVGAMIEKGTALALKGQGLNYLGAMCATRASLNIFEHLTTLSNITAKPILASG